MMISLPLSAAEKMTIAVMDFQAQDVARTEAVKISELIRNEMVNSGRYTVLERAQVDKILREQGFQMTGCTDITCAVQVGKLLSARKILVGSVMRFGNNVAVTGRVVDVEKGVAEFAEKERALGKEDIFYMVERFCDKLTLRITGKALYKKENLDTTYKSSSTQYYDPVKDPTAWLALSAGILSGVGFAAGYGVYQPKIDKLMKKYDDKEIVQGIWIGWSLWPIVNYNLMRFLGLKSGFSKISDVKDSRNKVYIASGAVGGFAIIMLATFIGRYVYHKYAVNDYSSSSNVAVFIPPQYFNAVDWVNRKPGFGLGISMRF
jgi:TolB-like protein